MVGFGDLCQYGSRCSTSALDQFGAFKIRLGLGMRVQNPRTAVMTLGRWECVECVWLQSVASPPFDVSICFVLVLGALLLKSGSAG